MNFHDKSVDTMNTNELELARIWRVLRNSDVYIRMDKLKEDFTYLIMARNAWFGIWRPEHKSFLISRFKFDGNYLFEEYHWDTGESHGTVKPIVELEKSPFTLSRMLKTNVNYEISVDQNTEEPILKYLNGLEEKYSGISLMKDLLKKR